MPAATLSPFYVWAGGKTKLLRHYAPIWPEHTGPYVEPFLGGGAVFAWRASLDPTISATLNDVNPELIGLLRAVRDDAPRFLRSVSALFRRYLAIDTLSARREWYYAQRERYWSSPTPARLFVLMRLSFNGVWQTCAASNGLFGTPAGLLNHTSLDQVLNAPLLRAWSAALARADLHAGSYDALALPSRPSLIYLDPPYRDSFTTYATVFDDAAQIALAHWYRAQVSAGHRVLLANRCVPTDTLFEDLLADIADFSYFDVTYTAGRRARTAAGFQAKPAREFLAISRP